MATQTDLPPPNRFDEPVESVPSGEAAPLDNLLLVIVGLFKQRVPSVMWSFPGTWSLSAVTDIENKLAFVVCKFINVDLKGHMEAKQELETWRAKRFVIDFNIVRTIDGETWWQR